jgi:hypothetical protein
MVFEAASQRVKSVANGDMRIFMRVVHVVIVPSDNLAAGHMEVDAHFEHIALLMARVLTFNRDMAGGDAIEKLLKFLGAVADAGLQCRRRIHVAKGNLERHLPRKSPLGASSLRRAAPIGIDPAQLRR